MLRWFVEEFKDDEEVGLIVKTHLKNNSTLDFHAVKKRVSMLLDSVDKNRKCKVYLVHGNLSEKEMISLYDTRYVNCYITDFSKVQAGLFSATNNQSVKWPIGTSPPKTEGYTSEDPATTKPHNVEWLDTIAAGSNTGEAYLFNYEEVV